MNIRKIGKILAFIALIAVAVTMIAPMIWALAISLQSPGMAYQTPPKLFTAPLRFDNYITVLESFDFLRYSLNSLFLCVVSIIATTIASSMIAFGLAIYDTKGLRRLFFIGLCTMYVPSVTMMVPSFVLWSKLGALDTYIPLLLPAFFGNVMWIFLLRQNFKDISRSFFEAAYIDGANPLYIFFRIYMPLSKPTLAYVVLQVFLGMWNNMMGPLLYVTTKEKYPLALALSIFKMENPGREELNMAAVMIAILPILLLYMFLQRYFVAGMQSSGVKE